MPITPFPTGGHAARRLHQTPGRLAVAAALVAVAMVLLPALGADAAPAAIGLGTAASFGVLAGSGITNTGPTTITGDSGTFPTTSMTGWGSVTQTGTNHAGDAVTQQAKTDLVTAYDAAAAAAPTATGLVDLVGMTLTTGVYRGGALSNSGALTLDAQGNPDAVFIFQAASTLITSSSSVVNLVNGAQACNVFWQVGSSATLGTNSTMVGTIMALTSITATTGATIQGRLLARNGAVTLDTNTITNTACAAPVTTTTTGGGTTTTTGGSGTPGGPGSPGATTSTTPDSTSTSTPRQIAFTG
jgi:hypothetical protein